MAEFSSEVVSDFDSSTSSCRKNEDHRSLEISAFPVISWHNFHHQRLSSSSSHQFAFLAFLSHFFTAARMLHSKLFPMSGRMLRSSSHASFPISFKQIAAVRMQHFPFPGHFFAAVPTSSHLIH
jgi:hypothetical protein